MASASWQLLLLMVGQQDMAQAPALDLLQARVVSPKAEGTVVAPGASPSPVSLAVLRDAPSCSGALSPAEITIACISAGSGLHMGTNASCAG